MITVPVIKVPKFFRINNQILKNCNQIYQMYEMNSHGIRPRSCCVGTKHFFKLTLNYPFISKCIQLFSFIFDTDHATNEGITDTSA